MDRIQLQLLGGFEARLMAGRPLTLPGKAQALLAYLAVRPGLAHPRDKLAALLWGDTGEAQARDSLRHTLAALRKASGAAASRVFVAEGQSFTLDPDAIDVDVVAFERRIAAATPEALEEAVVLYRGDLLEGLPVSEPRFEEWLLAERERLRELALEALARLLTHHSQSGAHERAIATAARLLSLDPLQEAVHRALMRLYATQGRRGAALKQYQICVSLLQREIGAEPEAETKHLYQDILQRRGALDPSVVPGVSVTASHPMPLQSAAGRREVTGDGVPLVGRDAEMGRLREALATAKHGDGQLVMILGDAGIGKSRIVRALAAEADDRGMLVLVGQAYESEQILPFGPWIDALRAADLTPEHAAVVALNAARRAELARILPELQSGPLPPAQDYRRLFEAVLELLERLGASRPVAVVLEDVHWADEMTLRLVAFIGHRVRSRPALLVFTARDDEVSPASVLAGIMEEARRDMPVAELRVGPLSRDHTAALVRSLARTGTDEATVRRLGEQAWTASEGNPFVVVETMRALTEGGVTAASDAVPFPDRVRQLVTRRLDRLSAGARQLAAIAAVIGREFDFTLLRTVVGGAAGDVAEGVEELVRRAVLHEVGEQLAFTHDRIREVAYEALASTRRRALHGAVLAGLEGSEALAPLAHHAIESGDLERGFDYSWRAAGAARAVFAHEEAVQHYGRARRCAETVRRTDRLAAIDEAVGDVEFARGRFEPAVEWYERAMAGASQRTEQARLNLKIGRIYTQYADARGPAFLQRALDMFEPATQPSGIAQATAMLGRYQHYLGRHTKALTLMEQARAIAEPLEDVVTLNDIYRVLSGACQHLMRMDESMHWARQAIALSERQPAPLVYAAYNFLAQDFYFLGRWDESLEWSDRTDEAGRHIGAEHRRAWARHDRAWALHGKGRLAAAAEAAREGVDLADATGEQRVAVQIRMVMARVEADLGRNQEAALAIARAAVAVADRLNDFFVRALSRFTLAYVHMRRHDGAAAARSVDELAVILSSSVEHRLVPIVAGGYAAEALVSAHRLAEAAVLADRTMLLAHEAGANHWGAVARRVSGQIHAAGARWDDATKAFDEAIVELGSLGSRLELGRAILHRGLMHRARGAAAAAAADVARAREVFGEVGATADLHHTPAP